jgi:hypothetical protein
VREVAREYCTDGLGTTELWRVAGCYCAQAIEELPSTPTPKAIVRTGVDNALTVIPELMNQAVGELPSGPR